MTEKKLEEVLPEDFLCTLKAEDYWEWRTTMEEMDHSKTSYSLTTMKMRLMESQAHILRMEIALFKSKLLESAAHVDKLKEDYKPFREKLEKKYNISFKDVTIREDWKVVKLPSDNQGGKDGSS